MTIKKFEKMGFPVNKEFELCGKYFIVQPTMDGFHYSIYCLSDKKMLCSRANLDTCYNKIREYTEKAIG
ncbi:MAG: hypothetical protein NC131_12005 [Roseburia sp.]|nr:hypothetical protein [Roseburia sp.]